MISGAVLIGQWVDGYTVIQALVVFGCVRDL